MKKAIFCFVILFGFLTTLLLAQSGWYIIPSPSEENLYDIQYHSFTASDWVMGANGTLFKTPDHGETWDTLISGTSYDIKGRYGPASYQDWIAGSSGTVLVSLDLGVTWMPRQPNTTEDFNTIFSRGSGTAYVAGTNGAVFYSSDIGITWANRQTPTSETLNCGIAPTSGTTLHAIVAGNNGVIFKTIDAGINWTTPNSGTSNNINGFGFGPTGVVFAVCDGGIILKTLDAGDNWTMVSSPTTEDLYAIDASGQNSSWIIACGANGILLKSTDAGENWFVQASPTTEHLYRALALSNNIHLVVGASGIILKTIDGGGNPVGIDKNLSLSEQFTLYQNYPNPINSETTISFNLASSGFVTLKIYNSLGNEVSTLVSENLNPGRYSFDWFTEGFDKGIYFFKLYVNGSYETKKCIVMNNHR